MTHTKKRVGRVYKSKQATRGRGRGRGRMQGLKQRQSGGNKYRRSAMSRGIAGGAAAGLFAL